MVHCKQPRRKPRAAPKNGERASGGAAAPLPGYMRPTSSSGSRAGRDAAVAPPAASALLPALDSSAPRAGRETCSSALRSSALAAHGRVCRYAYCSLKGHAHAPPLGSFVAARRRLIKTEQRMKHRGVSAFRNNNSTTSASNAGLGGDGLFVQVHPAAGARTVASSGSSSSCSDLSTEESRYVTFERRSCRDDPDVSVDGSCGSSDVISDGFAEMGTTARSLGRKGETDEEGEAWVDQDGEGSSACRSDISEELGARYQGVIMSKDHGGEFSVESSLDDISSAFGVMSFEDADSGPADAAATSRRNKLIMSRMRTTPKDQERIRAFNPRAPNFLPVEPDPDAEKVDLRHQTADDRKNAEEWMVDYALRKTVRKLARAQKRKVEMLVQAFETVLPPVPAEKNSVQQDDGNKSFAQTRSWQACS